MSGYIQVDTLKAAADTLSKVQEKSESSWILHHILDSNSLDFDPFGTINLPQIHLLGLDISITKHVVYMWVVSVFLFLTFYFASKSYRKSKVPKGVSNMLELLVVFVRDEIARPTIGKGYEKFLPYLLTVFFFILTCNFLGLIPYGSTVTSNISVTASLATLSFIVIQVGGINKNGPFGYFKGLIPHGIPVFLMDNLC